MQTELSRNMGEGSRAVHYQRNKGFPGQLVMEECHSGSSPSPL